MNIVCTSLKIPRVGDKLVPNIREVSSVELAKKIYISCAFISLLSSRKNGKADKAILVVSEPLDDKWEALFVKESIEISILSCGSSEYTVDNQYEWSITQYKYDALEYVCSLVSETDNICFLDCDTLTVESLDDLFKECDQTGLLLYDTRHSYSHPARTRIRNNYKMLYSEGNPIHYGGELVAGRKSAIQLFLNECKKVVYDMRNVDGLQNVADEHVTSIAIYKLQSLKVKNAGAYIFRFWTGATYIVSTNYFFDRIPIWHLPAEKHTGFQSLFRYYQKKSQLPGFDRVSEIMGMPSVKPPLKTLVLRKVNKLLGVFYKSNF